MPEYTPKLNIPKLLDSDTFSTETFGAIVVAIDENAADQLSVDNHISDNTSHVPFFVATGIANVYSVGLPKGFTLKKGIGISVEINVNNTGASTLNIANTGAKPIKKQNGNDVAAGQLKAGIIYTLRYNGTNFILQGEGATGNATASDLLSDKTASTDAGDITGTMPNRGAMTITPSSEQQTIPSGYHNGAGVILPGKRFASGTFNWTIGKVPDSNAKVIVNNLDFNPSTIVLTNKGSTSYSYLEYDYQREQWVHAGFSSITINDMFSFYNNGSYCGGTHASSPSNANKLTKITNGFEFAYSYASIGTNTSGETPNSMQVKWLAIE
jgi:hypothetical protein